LLELVAIDGLTVAEAAAAVGVRAGTTRVRLYRARRKLRTELEAAATQPLHRQGGAIVNREQTKPTDFERRLRAQLKAIVAERGAAEARLEAVDASTTTPAWRRRGPRLALGGTVALATAAAARRWRKPASHPKSLTCHQERPVANRTTSRQRP
jgi:hypothetical protein